MSRFWLGGDVGPSGSLLWAAEPWVLALAVGLAVVAMALAVWSGRGSRRGRAGRWLEAGAWAICLALTVISLGDPVWQEESGREEPGRVIVLVDGSRSMGVRDGEGPRSDRVSQVLDTLGSDLDIFTFDSDLRAGEPAGWTGRDTNLGAALSAAADRYLGQPVQGVVVITDGLDRGALRRAVSQGETVVPDLPGPVTFYQVGEATELHDLSIDDVVAGGFAFLRTPFALKAQVRGMPGQRTTVTLRREGRMVAEEPVVMDDEGRGTVRFEAIPTRVGRSVWEVAVPVIAGDAVPGNNAFPVVIRVVRDRTRVLQVSGAPSYDQKFLRLFLKEDPSVDLVSFFILRTHEDFGAGWHSNELSLIAFPYERLFSEELASFDLVVLQNFNYKPYFERGSNVLLDNIANYVREGGALVMIGGDRSFDLAEYAGTAIADVLPVKLGVAGPKTDGRVFQPVLTDAGAVHPVTRLAGTRDASRDIWRRLPGMDGLNLSRGIKDDAAVLLQHPTLRADGSPMPVLAVREVGEGRSMALMVDASWRWSFSEAARGHGNQAYLRFWKGALRWLVADPDERRVVVSPSRENVMLGDPVQLRIRVRDTGYGPIAGTPVEGTVMGPSGTASSFEVVTDATGEAVTAFTPSARGAHRVLVRAGTGAADEAETVFSVSARDPELEEIAPDARFLSQLAALYGDRGAYRGPKDTDPPLLDTQAVRKVHDRKQTSLAAPPLSALLFALLASLSWWVRRQAGAR
jgi:uncharacterized membrane protein